jgi:hypothetical protein
MVIEINRKVKSKHRMRVYLASFYLAGMLMFYHIIPLGSS